jgi:Straboviridae dCMP hydroxymethylase
MIHSNYVASVREEFSYLFKNCVFLTDKSGCRMLEIRSATFKADQESIFGEVNRDYIARELAWYESMSLSVDDFPGGAPAVWRKCASNRGLINSNYGYRIWSTEQGSQYDRVASELTKNPDSRRAVMVYTNPRMWDQYDVDGMSDFICTNAVQYFNRYGCLCADVQMRSNDAVFGYKNDRAWQYHVLNRLAGDLGMPVVPSYPVTWHAGSLHVYERHFYLVDWFSKTGEHAVSKKKYAEIYPDSEWCAGDA